MRAPAPRTTCTRPWPCAAHTPRCRQDARGPALARTGKPAEWISRVVSVGLAPRQRVPGLLGGRFGIAGLVMLLTLAIYGLSSADRSLADAPAPLFLLVVPLALASIAFGVRV